MAAPFTRVVTPVCACLVRNASRPARVIPGTLHGGTRGAKPLVMMNTRNPESGKAGYALAWLLGIPLPILAIVYLFSHGC